MLSRLTGRPVPEPAVNNDDEDQFEDEEDEEVPGDEQEVWKVGQPQTQPLTYQVVAKDGRYRAKDIAFTVDFTDPDSVRKANKARALGVWRAKRSLNIDDPLRPSTAGREYSEVNDDFIAIIHEEWAQENDGERITMPELTRIYNEQFPGEDRSRASISSHVDHIKELKDMRASYGV